MARITVEDCLQRIKDGNRFALIHLVVERIRQHRRGAPFLVDCKNKEIVKTLREVAEGKVTMENIRELNPKRGKTEPTTSANESKGEGEVLDEPANEM